MPELLQDIRLLDLLELTGSTVQASQLLNLSQPTVSRRYRSLAADFGLLRDPRTLRRCRYGSSAAMRLLRLGCRAHRMAAGVARIGADLMHHHLLDGCSWLLPTPVRFRSVEEWAELVRQGVLDAAVISGLELGPRRHPQPAGVWLQKVGVMPLGLAASRCSPDAVLVPHRGVAAGLHQVLISGGYPLKPLNQRGLTPQECLSRLIGADSAIVLDPACCTAGGWAQALKVQPLQPELKTTVWLLLPRSEQLPVALARVIDQIQGRLLPEPYG